MSKSFSQRAGRRSSASRKKSKAAPSLKLKHSTSQPLVSHLAGKAIRVSLGDVRIDGDTQPRSNMDPDTVARYAEKMQSDPDTGLIIDHEEKAWPELVVFQEGEVYWLADGFHRLHAARQRQLEEFQAKVHQGSLRDAIAYSLRVNEEHGLPRTRADKRRAMMRALTDSEWQTYSDRRLAKMCAVSNSSISRLRQQLEAAGEIPRLRELYKEDGEVVEREPAPIQAPALTRTTSGTPKKTAPKVSSSARAVATRGQRALTQIAWGGEPGAGPFDAIIAYPEDEAHWSALAKLATAKLTTGGLILTPLYAGSRWAYRGPTMLDALVDAGTLHPPHVVSINSQQRHYWVWANTARTLDPLLADPAELVTSLERGLVVGKAIDK